MKTIQPSRLLYLVQTASPCTFSFDSSLTCPVLCVCVRSVTNNKEQAAAESVAHFVEGEKLGRGEGGGFQEYRCEPQLAFEQMLKISLLTFRQVT